MKKLTLFTMILLLAVNFQAQNFHTSFSPPGSGSDMSLVFQANFGYTIVDVPEAMEIPEVNPITGDGLSDWENVNMHFVGQLIFNSSGKTSYGIEAGANRLYWWEEKDSDPNRSPYWYWGSIWTYQVGGIVKFNFAKKAYFLTGASVHIFSNDSGATVGIPAAVGYNIPLSKKVELPIEFRVDVIFGKGTPIAVNGGLGLKFEI